MDKEIRQKLEDGRIIMESALDFLFETSREKTESHLVDLRKYDGSGACWCENFRFRIEPKLKSGEIKPHEKESQCKHIVTARAILAQKLIDASRKIENEQKSSA